MTYHTAACVVVGVRENHTAACLSVLCCMPCCLDRAGAQLGKQGGGRASQAAAAAAGGGSIQQEVPPPRQQQHDVDMAVDAAAVAPAAQGPPPLSFVPQSTITPAAALKQPGCVHLLHVGRF